MFTALSAEAQAALQAELDLVLAQHRRRRDWVLEVLRASTSKPQALTLLDGELLEDLDGVDPSFDTWLAMERERLRDRARTLAETLLRAAGK